ncbi:ferrochelatase [Corynebacterium mastitidis]|uniref:Coproporphyrin III ferrochelatase n=1 Tax=Corynebacterium mastitidis TaxID=161890 RepID=A0A2N0XAI7_9CORY|nr:ferrochelatase [Corynebacterium mastitidis]MCH6196080.1 ferrochelatase [Corynebacterium mastitidis]PKF69691.1 ferrochelatase [Corynebacterium mastitidis]
MSPEQPYDALLVLSFGGPEGPEEVVPFLENVTRGRGIPRERLKVVGEHYFHFDGISPLNRLNKEIIANVEGELRRRGLDLPVYFGNRNWHPFGEATAEQMAADGVRNALVLSTSAWGGYSGCRQYDEDIQRIRQHLEQRGLPAVTFTKLRQFYDHPKFIEAMAEALKESHAKFAPEDAARTIFTAHSVPLSANNAAGGPEDAGLYERQVAEASRLVAQAAGIEDYDLVWQSRSGSPAIPWLEPDVVDHTCQLHEERGVNAIVVCPIGFISDHMEVVWDLDTELRQAVDERGMRMERTRTAGPTELFTSMVVDLVEELNRGRAPEGLGEVTVNGCTVNGEPCHPGCCQPAKRPISRTA